jgi:SAM-dependent methyltransferase
MTNHGSRLSATSLAEEFIRQRARDAQTFNRCVSPRDEMLLFEAARSPNGTPDEALLRYFRSGDLMMHEYRRVVEPLFGGFGEVESLLEFACGYGRFTRFLVQEMPRERIVVSDILTDALRFQREQFLVTAVASAENPDDYREPRRFQLVLVSSLFSHLPATTFGRWLGRLYDRLADDGVLIFSVHDHAAYPGDVRLDERGFAFFATSESATLDAAQYGTAVVNERFVAEAIRAHCPGAGEPARIQRGLWEFQDLYLVARAGRRDVHAAARVRGPRGYLDHCRLHEPAASYLLDGWAFDLDDGSRVERIEVRVGGELAQICIPGHPRPDVAEHFRDGRLADSGWACLLSAARVETDDVVSVEVVASSGRTALLAFDRLGRLLESPR